MSRFAALQRPLRRAPALAGIFAMMLFVMLSGCKIQPVPDDHTSLALDPGTDPGPPASKLSMVWLHHSTGDAILKGGLLEALKKNNIEFHDINYKQAKVGDYVIGDHTDPPDFPKTFNTPKYFEVVKGWELTSDRKQHHIVMFKSCFPASKIKTDGQLEQYEKWYMSLLPTFKKHPGILFIPMSTPPLVKAWTNEEQGKRARKWAKWITTIYPTKAPNVKVFDLFDALAVREGKPLENRLVPQFGLGVRDAHPSPAGAKAVTRMFIPWLNRAIKEYAAAAKKPADKPATTRPAATRPATPAPKEPVQPKATTPKAAPKKIGD